MHTFLRTFPFTQAMHYTIQNSGKTSAKNNKLFQIIQYIVPFFCTKMFNKHHLKNPNKIITKVNMTYCTLYSKSSKAVLMFRVEISYILSYSIIYNLFFY